MKEDKARCRGELLAAKSVVDRYCKLIQGAIALLHAGGLQVQLQRVWHQFCVCALREVKDKTERRVKHLSKWITWWRHIYALRILRSAQPGGSSKAAVLLEQSQRCIKWWARRSRDSVRRKHRLRQRYARTSTGSSVDLLLVSATSLILTIRTQRRGCM